MSADNSPERFSQPLIRIGVFALLAAIILGNGDRTIPSAYAAHFKEAKPAAPPPDETQAKILQINQLLKSGKVQQSGTMILAVLDSMTSVDDCLSLANVTQSYGFPLMEVRRQCVRKALTLCRTSHDLMLVALSSRQYQFFELTRQAISTLIDKTNTDADLQNLALNAQHLGLNDVAEMAMEKVYQQAETPEDTVCFAQEARSMGMEKLVRKAIVDLIKKEDNPIRLCVLINSIEPLEIHDLNRQLLKKALDNCQSVDDYTAVLKGAKTVNELDIANVADYRIKKTQLIQQIQQDQESYEQQVQDWQKKVEEERARKESEMEEAKAAVDKIINDPTPGRVVLPGEDRVPPPVNIPGVLPGESPSKTPSSF